MTSPEPVPGRTPLRTPLVTQADCWRRQHEAARVLTAILDAHPGLLAICWMLDGLGGRVGEVDGLDMLPDQARATFAAWQRALGVGNVREAPVRDAGIIRLAGRTHHGIIRVGLTVTVYYPLPDEEEPAATPAPGAAPRPADRTDPARGSQTPAAGARRTSPAMRAGCMRAGPLILPRPTGDPQPRITPRCAP